MTMRVRRAASSMPSSRSKSQERFCCAIRRRCSRLASADHALEMLPAAGRGGRAGGRAPRRRTAPRRRPPRRTSPCRRDTAGRAARCESAPGGSHGRSARPGSSSSPGPSASRSGPGRRWSREARPARTRPRSPRPGRRRPGLSLDRSGRRRSRSPGRRRSPGPGCPRVVVLQSAISSPSSRSRISWRAARAKASWSSSASRQLLEVAAGGAPRRRPPQVDHRLAPTRGGARPSSCSRASRPIAPRPRRVVLASSMRSEPALVERSSQHAREIAGTPAMRHAPSASTRDLLEASKTRARSRRGGTRRVDASCVVMAQRSATRRPRRARGSRPRPAGRAPAAAMRARLPDSEPPARARRRRRASCARRSPAASRRWRAGTPRAAWCPRPSGPRLRQLAALAARRRQFLAEAALVVLGDASRARLRRTC